MCPTLFYLNFFEIRLTRGDVWAKTEVLVIGAFLRCILGSYLIQREFGTTCVSKIELNYEIWSLAVYDMA